MPALFVPFHFLHQVLECDVDRLPFLLLRYGPAPIVGVVAIAGSNGAFGLGQQRIGDVLEAPVLILPDVPQFVN